MPSRVISRVIVGDARQVLSRLRPNSVTLTITSPPYMDLKDYGMPNQIGFQQTPKQYLADLEVVFRSCHAATRESGTLWVIIDRLKEDGKVDLLPLQVAGIVEESGWSLIDVVVWNKLKSLPYTSRNGLRHQYEFILAFCKGKPPRLHTDRIRDSTVSARWWRRYPERHHPKGLAPTDIWDFRIPTQGKWGTAFLKHQCPFPPELVERIITLASRKGDLVLDPFAGSCVVPGVAELLKRRSIGIELNDEFVHDFRRSVRPGLKMWWERRSRETCVLARQRGWRERETWKLRKLKLGFLVLKWLSREKQNQGLAWVQIESASLKRATITIYGANVAQEILKGVRGYLAGKPGGWFELDIHVKHSRRSQPPGNPWIYSTRSFLKPVGRLGVLHGALSNGSPTVRLASTLRASPDPSKTKSRKISGSRRGYVKPLGRR